MARMWPAELPAWIVQDERRSAEVRAWRRLSERLDDSWSVYYSRPWWGLNEKGGEVEGEADFIVASESSGILFIEVKGGVVAWNPAKSEWTSRDRNGVSHHIRDPVQQAYACKHRYLDRLRTSEGWPAGYVRFRHGVILPDSNAPGRGMLTIAGYELPLFCFADGFDDRLDDWVRERLAAHEANGPSREVPPGEAAIGILNRLVADPVSLRVPLRRNVRNDIERFDQLLTSQQMLALTLMGSMPRLLIEGGAGTGKTVLALEMAARLADEGCAVALLCYNEPLAEYLKARIGDRPSLNAASFHGMCGSLVREAGLDPGPVGPSFFDETLPRTAAAALERLPARRWDAVIVDEGQDFPSHWWPLIDLMLRQDSRRILQVFVDANQAFYSVPRGLLELLGAKPVHLRINLRNTKAIAAATEPLYSGPLIIAAGPDGEHPAEHAGPFPDACAEAAGFAVRLIRDERLVCDEIAILVPGEQPAKRVRAVLDQLRIRHCTATDRRADFVTVDTIRRFKGLEAPVVLLAVDRIAADNRELAYVSVSRAQSRLYVFGETADTQLGRALATARGRRA